MIRHVEGLHLTATNRRHIGQMIGTGMAQGVSGPLSYSLAPIDGKPGFWRYSIAKRERDDWGRSQVRRSSGIVELIERGKQP